MRSAGPSVRNPRPEQLTRQAAPGAGLQRQGGAQGPQPRPGIPASAPSHRPRPRASARRAGGIVRAARAWPQPGARPAPATAAQEGPMDCMVGRGAGFRGGRGLSACATLARRSGPAAFQVHGRPLARSRSSAGRRRLLLLPARRGGAGRGGTSSGPAPYATESGRGGVLRLRLRHRVGRGKGGAPGVWCLEALPLRSLLWLLRGWARGAGVLRRSACSGCARSPQFPAASEPRRPTQSPQSQP